MNFIKKIFCRRKQFKAQPKQLRIDGCKTSMTATPDDAELAAQALLESRIYGDKAAIKRAQRHASMIYAEREQARCDSGKEQRKAAKKRQPSAISHQTSSTHDAQYYQELSEKIKESHEHDARMAMRYVAYCEEELKHQPSDISHLTSLEHGLFKHQDTVEREGGDLLKRWQKCLAECIVRQMVSGEEENEK